MSPKVKTVKSSESRVRNNLNKSSIQSSNCNEKNHSDWVESDEQLCFNETINPRGLKSKKKKTSVETISPSVSGSTKCLNSSKAKYTAKFYRRRLRQCKTLIKILIAAKRETRVKKYIEKSVWILDDSYERNSRKKRSVEADGVKEENPRASRIDVIDLKSDSDQDTNNARKSGELSKPDKRIPEGKSVPSTSKQLDESDNESAIRSLNPQWEYSVNQNLEREILSDSSDDITIISRGQSKKESQGLRSNETKEASDSFFTNNIISWSTITRSQKNVQKSNSRVKDSEDRLPKDRESSSAINSSKSSATSKCNENAATLSKSENLNPSEIFDKKPNPATPGIGCLCKSKKLKSLPTLSYKVPSDTRNPAPKFRNHQQGKSGQEVEIKETSLIREKKGKKLYSPLELKYGEGSKNLAKENEDVSKPSHLVNKDSASHERVSKNSEGTVACSELPVRQNRSKQLGCATFSTYSIPVSIEIHMVPDKMKARNFSGNLKQSMITNYYPLERAQERRLQRKNVDSNSIDAVGRNNRDENGNKIAGRQNSKDRALPVVKSDVLLQNRAELSFSDKYPLQRPRLNISSQEYLYSLLKYPMERAQSPENQTGNQNFIFCNNVRLSQQYNMTNEPADYEQTNPETIDDSDCSIVPPSYSVSSDDGNDDPHEIGTDFIVSLDNEQWEEMFAPWDKVDNLEKVNRWNAEKKF